MTELKIRTFPRSLPKALESVARLVPGYRGYSSKDDRREEDKRLRTQIARCLREASQDLHRAVRTLRFEGVPPGLNRLGQVAKRPWVVGDEVVPRWVTTLAVTFDHRVADGEQASRFLADVAAILEDPGLALAF